MNWVTFCLFAAGWTIVDSLDGISEVRINQTAEQPCQANQDTPRQDNLPLQSGKGVHTGGYHRDKSCPRQRCPSAY